MEPQKQIETPLAHAKLSNPAIKWLYLGIIGLIICFSALSYGALFGSTSTGTGISPTVLAQVFGFTPYYFINNNPPDSFRLNEQKTKFIGNTLTFELTNAKKEVLTISEKSLPGDYKNATTAEKSFDTELGLAAVGGPNKGRNTGSIVTKDKTLITIDAPDTVASRTIESMLRSFVAVPKGADAITKP